LLFRNSTYVDWYLYSTYLILWTFKKSFFVLFKCSALNSNLVCEVNLFVLLERSISDAEGGQWGAGGKQQVSREQLSREHVSKVKVNREKVSKVKVSREHVSWKHVSREHVRREHVSREHVSRDTVSRKKERRDSSAGNRQAGSRGAGNRRAGSKRTAKQWNRQLVPTYAMRNTIFFNRLHSNLLKWNGKGWRGIVGKTGTLLPA
jgi:hypothetical protein